MPRSAADQAVDMVHRALKKLPPVDCPVTHHFAPGLYAREMFAPAGTVIISKRHKTEHLHVVIEGRLKVWTEDGGVAEVRAGHVGVTKPGTRRIGLMLEDTRWITLHPTTETDLDTIEAATVEDVTVLDEGEQLGVMELQKQLTGGVA